MVFCDAVGTWSFPGASSFATGNHGLTAGERQAMHALVHRQAPILLALIVAAGCGDSPSTSASASGTGDTGTAASTGAAASTGHETPTTAADGTHSASDSQGSASTGDTGGVTTTVTGDVTTTVTSDVTGTGDTVTTGPISASGDSEGTTQTTQDGTGTSGSTGEACVDECVEDQPQCVGDDALQVCGVGDLGCLAWGEPTPCAADHVCENGACVAGCVDACALGSKQCVVGGVSSCVDDPDSSCSVWSDAVACGVGKVCDAGVCVTQAALCLEDCVWTKQQVNTGVDFYSVWGSGAKAAWTVGASGTALYYNGVSWKAVDTGVDSRLECVHGSAADDVYAIDNLGAIIRWDGAEWLPHVDLEPNWGESACLSVIGTKDLLAIVFDSSSETLRLFRVKDGVKSLLATPSQNLFFAPAGSKIRSISLHAFSAAAALGTGYGAYRWDNVSFADMVAPNPSFGLWALAPDFAYAAASHSGIGHRWDGQGWKIVNPGLDGALHMFTGTAKDRVFAVGETKVGAVAAIVNFDGFGWSKSVTPPEAKALFASWSAATGEVFAVGKSGTILIGK